MTPFGGAVVAPPGDVVEFAAVVADGAAGDGAGAVETAEGSALGSVGQPGGASEVQLSGGVEHDTVAHHDGVGVGGSGEFGEYSGGDLDGDRELGDGAVVSGGVGIDHRHELGLGRSWSWCCAR